MLCNDAKYKMRFKNYLLKYRRETDLQRISGKLLCYDSQFVSLCSL